MTNTNTLNGEDRVPIEVFHALLQRVRQIENSFNRVVRIRTQVNHFDLMDELSIYWQVKLHKCNCANRRQNDAQTLKN